MPPEMPEYEDQDRAEVLDEDNLLPDTDRMKGGDDGLTFEGITDVFDATTARGDGDVDGDDDALDEDEEDDELLTTLGDTGEDDDDLDEDDTLDALSADDLTRQTLDVDFEDADLVDGTARTARDEVELVDVEDADGLGGASALSVADLESDTLSDEDLMELDYKDPTTGETRGAGTGDVERGTGTGTSGSGADVERATGQAGARTGDVERGAGTPTGGAGPGGSGGQEYADVAAADLPPDHPAHPDREDERLDQGLEETFPASDPVSAKHIT